MYIYIYTYTHLYTYNIINKVVFRQHKTVQRDDIGINVKKPYECHQSKVTEYKLFTITRYLKI